MIHVERHPRVQSALKLPGDVAVEVSDLPLALAPVDDELDTSPRVLDRNSIEYLPRDEVVNAVLSLGELIVHTSSRRRRRERWPPACRSPGRAFGGSSYSPLRGGGDYARRH